MLTAVSQTCIIEDLSVEVCEEALSLKTLEFEGDISSEGLSEDCIKLDCLGSSY